MRAMQQSIAELEAKLSGNDATEGDDDDMEEVEREHAVKLIELKVYQVIDDIDMLHSEIEMAKQMEAMKLKNADQDKREGSAPRGDKEPDWRLDSQSYSQIDPRTGKAAHPILNSSGQPMRPFILTNDRQRIKDSVFRPDWALPTMTVDEYLQQEQERGNII
ncbi:Type 2A phosphatase-associated protein 42, partial [Coemansia sp. RSA 2703]